MKPQKSHPAEKRKLAAAKDQPTEASTASHLKDKPLFHGHPEGNVEKLIEHGRQMGF